MKKQRIGRMLWAGVFLILLCVCTSCVSSGANEAVSSCETCAGLALSPALALVYLSECRSLPDHITVDVCMGSEWIIRVSSTNTVLYEVNLSNYLSLGNLYLRQSQIRESEENTCRSPIGLAVLWAYGQGVDLNGGFDVRVTHENAAADQIFIQPKGDVYGKDYMLSIDKGRGVVTGTAGE